MIFSISVIARDISPLHKAVSQGNFNKIKNLVENGADIEQVGYIRTPLMSAVQLKNLKVVKYLISKKANINYVNRFGHTLLHVAAMSPNNKILKYILTFNLDINKLDLRGGSVLDRSMRYVALQDKGLENMKLVLNQKNGNKHINLISNGYTPLMVANDKKDVVKLLLKYGADTKITNKKGDTALSMLMSKVCRNHGDVVECATLDYNPQADKELIALLNGKPDIKPIVEPKIYKIDSKIWEYKKKKDQGKLIKFKEAHKYCEDLNIQNIEFRLPSFKEINSLSSQKKMIGFVLNGVEEYYLDPKKTPDMEAWHYWFEDKKSTPMIYSFINKNTRLSNNYDRALVKCISK